jgi:hypothetical protein
MRGETKKTKPRTPTIFFEKINSRKEKKVPVDHCCPAISV